MNKRNYELTYLISPELDQQKLEDFSKKINSLIQEKGEIVKEDTPKRIALVYPIQKKRSAFLCAFELKSEPEQIDALKNELEKEKNILRFLIIKKEIKKERKVRRIVKRIEKVEVLDFLRKGEPKTKPEQ